ncbi:MAG: hypothetical protein IKO57_06810 [Treponema sp.]|nr:hypothetical protein [Treponema sp.]
MKRKLLFFASLFLAFFFVGCGSTNVGGVSQISTAQDPDGTVMISNETNENIIVFVNGEARKKVRPTIQSCFKMEITESDAKSNNNRKALISMYPEKVFSDGKIALTAENEEKRVFKQYLDFGQNYEFSIDSESISKLLEGMSSDNMTQAEFVFRFPSHAKSYLIELYSDKECRKRFVLGSVSPGQELHAFKNPEAESEITVYAKYVRNDGKST